MTKYNLLLATCWIAILVMQCEQPPTQATVDLKNSPNQAELFAPDLISTGLYERDLAIGPDGSELIYTLGTNTGIRNLIIMREQGGAWAQEVMPFSGAHQDIEPFYSPEGQVLYFASDRPMPQDTMRSDYNIWKVARSGTGWADPEALSNLINTPAHEFFPAVTDQGHVYFTASREDGMGGEDILVSRLVNGEYQTPEALDSNVNSALDEFNAFVSADDRFIVFSSYGRLDGLGGGDLYWSERGPDGQWSVAQHFGPAINTSRLEYCPFVDFNNGNLYFTSNRIAEGKPIMATVEDFHKVAHSPQNGFGDIYRIAWDKARL